MKTIIIFLIAFLYVMLCSCSEEQATQQNSSNWIQRIQNDSNWVEITDTASVNFNYGFLFGSKLDQINFGKDGRFVVTNDSLYNILLDSVNSNNNFIEENPPEINFSEKSLIGYDVVSTKHKTSAQLFINETMREYLYIITINIYAFNDSLIAFDARFSSKWYLVPKLRTDYKFRFETIQELIVR